MSNRKQIRLVAGYQFKQWKKNPRVWLSFLLAFVLCLMLTDKVISFAHEYGTSIQMFEVFVWTFGDPGAILLTDLILILLFMDMPFVQPSTPYCIHRTGRRNWLIGQLLYVTSVTILYISFIFLVILLLCSKDAFPGNVWSETAALLGYSELEEQVSLAISVNIMEQTLPYECVIFSFLLLFLYTLFSASFMMVCNLGRFSGMGAVGLMFLNLYGIFLTPQTFVRFLKLPESLLYKANLLTGWLSPLSHAVYSRHSFGYDRLPKIWESCLLFLFLILLNFWIAERKIRRYEFTFMTRR